MGDGFVTRSEELSKLEKEINPLLSDDPRVVFNHTLVKILDEEVSVLRTAHVFQKLPPR